MIGVIILLWLRVEIWNEVDEDELAATHTVCVLQMHVDCLTAKKPWKMLLHFIHTSSHPKNLISFFTEVHKRQVIKRYSKAYL